MTRSGQEDREARFSAFQFGQSQYHPRVMGSSPVALVGNDVENTLVVEPYFTLDDAATLAAAQPL